MRGAPLETRNSPGCVRDKPGSPRSRCRCLALPVPVGTVHPAAEHLFPVGLTPKMPETLPFPRETNPTPRHGESWFSSFQPESSWFYP